MRVLGFLAVAALVMSGCSGSESKEPGPDFPPPEAGRGNIFGVVVDDAIRPIVGANLSLPGLGLTTTSDVNGEFTFTDLAPGTYLITATAVNYVAVQTAADVVAGEAVRTKVQLRFDPTPKPYPLTWHLDGLMQVWGGYGQYILEEFTPNGTGSCACRVFATPDLNATSYVYEAYWQHSLPDPGELAEYYWIVNGSGIRDDDYCFSPCITYGDLEDFEQGGTMYARLDGPDFTVAAQQKFQLFFTVWHHGEAPDGWTVVTSGA